MDNEELIPIELFCSSYSVDLSFVHTLHDAGLVQVITQRTRQFIPGTELAGLERMLRLHEDLGINIEGLGAVHDLLLRMETMQEEMRALRNRLRRYEEGA
ncbi:MAG: chaperone modulator CbpM [Flavobacteriales bacterium]